MRRAIGKKICSLMDKMADKFVKGAVKNGLSKAKAKQIFELIDKLLNMVLTKAILWHIHIYQTDG